ncbi:MAG: M28 family peptidase [Planctomycetes bacterium]|nr:M28 family peptidase [Planctomycetota bacterium]
MLRSIMLMLLAALLLTACDGKAVPAPTPEPAEQEKDWKTTVDGAAVLQRTKRILSWGPRVAGSKGSLGTRLEIKSMLAEVGIAAKDIIEQSFEAKTPNPPTQGKTTFTNIIARIPGRNTRGLALAAHYDSKHFEEFKFLGANDAASSVALVIELVKAEVVRAKTTPRENTLWLLFFDGEEAYVDWHTNNDNTYGSREFVKHLAEYPVRGLVLVDMVGTKNILLADDANSSAHLKDILKRTSRDVLGYNLLARPFSAVDDHVPFRDAKVPCVDLIDHAFDTSTWWHTVHDTLENLDQRSLEKVGTMLAAALPALEQAVNQ